jgi:putative ABC transport system substrate-binding protein
MNKDDTLVSRRRFLVGALVLSVNPRLGAAQSPKTLRIGFLTILTAEENAPYLEALRDGLKALGYVEGRNISLELSAAGSSEPLSKRAADLVAMNVDIIVADSTPAAMAAIAATRSIPIVFAGPSDPVGSGLVDSLARPGRNATGLTDMGKDLAAKRLELLKQAVPGLKRVAVLGSRTDPVWEAVRTELQPASRRLGITVTPVVMASPEQLEAIFSDLGQTAEALYIAPQAIFWEHRQQIVTLAARARLPSIAEAREFVQPGGFMSYGTDYLALMRAAARYVDKILMGASPGDLKVEGPEKFQLCINLGTAKALGLTVPEPLLAAADELIQ